VEGHLLSLATALHSALEVLLNNGVTALSDVFQAPFSVPSF
jgi:hypothetical protein